MCNRQVEFTGKVVLGLQILGLLIVLIESKVTGRT